MPLRSHQKGKVRSNTCGGDRTHIDLGACCHQPEDRSTNRAVDRRVDSNRVGVTRDGVGVGTAGAYGRSSLISSGNPSYASNGGRRDRTFNNFEVAGGGVDRGAELLPVIVPSTVRSPEITTLSSKVTLSITMVVSSSSKMPVVP